MPNQNSLKPPLNPKKNYSTSSKPNINGILYEDEGELEENKPNKTTMYEPRSSSLSKLGERNYNQMVKGYLSPKNGKQLN